MIMAPILRLVGYDAKMLNSTSSLENTIKIF